MAKGVAMRSFLVLAALLAGEAWAHARWNKTGPLKPRTDSAGLKEPAPCGGAAIDETRRATLTAGDTITVTWEETVDHPGSYKLSFAQDGANFTLIEEIPDDQDGAVNS